MSNDSSLEKLSEYFERVNGQAVCKIIDCTSSLTRFSAFYLKRHIRTKHLSIFKHLFPSEVENEIQQAINAFETKQNALFLVTGNGYPLSLLEKPSFRFLIQPRMDELCNHGYGVAITRKKMVQYIESTSNEIRERIKNELNTVPLCSFMLDIATKATLSVLGVRASFFRNDIVVVRLLGVIHLTERHTGENIAAEVQQLLASFGKSIEEIYAMTTDNGANMLKTTREINKMIMNGDGVELNNPTNSGRDDHDDDLAERSGQRDVVQEESDEEEEEYEYDADEIDEHGLEQRYATIIHDMTSNMTLQNDYVALIPQIRCCAHTLQLCIHDALTRSNARRVLSQIREMCKSLRNQVINIELRKLSPKTILPPLDIVTRWCSGYIMVFFIDLNQLLFFFIIGIN